MSINIKIRSLIVLLALIVSWGSITGQVNDGWVIVIDPGHGGRDPGAVGSFSKEKDITLAVALKTGEYLEQNIKNVKVIYTRKTDVSVDLLERSEIANKNKADLFVSIHVNALEGRNAYGTETYIMGHHKDQQNLEVAMKENEVILLEKDFSEKYEEFDPKSPESYIMFTLYQSAYSEQSTRLASTLQSQFKERVGRYDRGVKQAGFWVLYRTTMPSILTEIGFITNVNEEKYLNSKQGQDYIASAIFRACRDYINDIEKKSVISYSAPEVPADSGPKKITASSSEPDIIFRVQLAASSRRISTEPSNFKNIQDVREITSGSRYRYVSGTFSEYSKAVEYRREMEKIFPGAFVIAVSDDKVLPLQEALDRIKKGK
jgi:N-acetylmuramoyl-L-alanine amidase